MGISQVEIGSLLNKHDPLILEIGAHYGSDTRRFLEVFSDIRIYSFEPDPRCIEEFRRRVKSDRSTLVEAAVSCFDGVASLNLSGGWPVKVPRLVRNLGLRRLYTRIVLMCRARLGVGIQDQWTGSSSIKKSLSHSKQWPWLSFDKAVKVRVIQLDTWAEKNGIDVIDFIWMDVQGAERDVIQGGVSALKRTKYVFVEYGATSAYPDAMNRDETIQIFEDYGFELVPEYSDKKKVGNLLLRKGAAIPNRHGFPKQKQDEAKEEGSGANGASLRLPGNNGGITGSDLSIFFKD